MDLETRVRNLEGSLLLWQRVSLVTGGISLALAGIVVALSCVIAFYVATKNPKFQSVSIVDESGKVVALIGRTTTNGGSISLKNPSGTEVVGMGAAEDNSGVVFVKNYAGEVRGGWSGSSDNLK